MKKVGDLETCVEKDIREIKYHHPPRFDPLRIFLLRKFPAWPSTSLRITLCIIFSFLPNGRQAPRGIQGTRERAFFFLFLRNRKFLCGIKKLSVTLSIYIEKGYRRTERENVHFIRWWNIEIQAAIRNRRTLGNCC